MQCTSAGLQVCMAACLHVCVSAHLHMPAKLLQGDQTTSKKSTTGQAPNRFALRALPIHTTTPPPLFSLLPSSFSARSTFGVGRPRHAKQHGLFYYKGTRANWAAALFSRGYPLFFTSPLVLRRCRMARAQACLSRLCLPIPLPITKYREV